MSRGQRLKWPKARLNVLKETNTRWDGGRVHLVLIWPDVAHLAGGSPTRYVVKAAWCVGGGQLVNMRSSYCSLTSEKKGPFYGLDSGTWFFNYPPTRKHMGTTVNGFHLIASNVPMIINKSDSTPLMGFMLAKMSWPFLCLDSFFFNQWSKVIKSRLRLLSLWEYIGEYFDEYIKEDA